jgi:hypothetical protein
VTVDIDKALEALAAAGAGPAAAAMADIAREEGYANLRTPGLRHVYPRPRQYPDIAAVIYCPVCGCEKSGDISEPNSRWEECGDTDCRCHEVMA